MFKHVIWPVMWSMYRFFRRLDKKDVFTLVICAIILTYAMYGKYKYDNPPLPKCVDIYNESEVCEK